MGIVLLIVLAVALKLGGFLELGRGSSTVASPGPAAPVSSNGTPSASSSGVAPTTQTPKTTTPDQTGGSPPEGAFNVASAAVVTVPATAPDSIDAAGQSVSYQAGNMLDKQPSTAWRMRADGAGGVVELNFPDFRVITAVGLINGYAKIDPANGASRYDEERRITSVTWVFDDARSIRQTLQDHDREPQFLSLVPLRAQKVSLHIEQTTRPGSRDHDYTAISELYVIGR